MLSYLPILYMIIYYKQYLTMIILILLNKQRQHIHRVHVQHLLRYLQLLQTTIQHNIHLHQSLHFHLAKVVVENLSHHQLQHHHQSIPHLLDLNFHSQRVVVEEILLIPNQQPQIHKGLLQQKLW